MKSLYEYIVEFRNLIGTSNPDDMYDKQMDEKANETLAKCAEELGLKNIEWVDRKGGRLMADKYAKVIIGDPKKEEVCLYVTVGDRFGPDVDFLDNLGKESLSENGKWRIPDSWRTNASRMRRRGDLEGACTYTLKNAMKLQPKLKHIPDESFQGM